MPPLNISALKRVIRGVPPSRQSLMAAAASPAGPPLECVPYGSPAGATAVPIVPDSLNDDYCDCADGADEPGTAACAGAVTHRTFWCTAVTDAGADEDDGDGGGGGGGRGDAASATGGDSGLAPGAVAFEGGQLLYPSAVGDGVCDCCDGSDEASGVCGSTCGVAAEVAAAVADEAAAVVETGLADRVSMVASASEAAARDAAALAAARRAVAAAKRRVAAATARVEQTIAWKDAVRAAAEAAVTPTAAAETQEVAAVVTPEVASPPTEGVQPGGSLDEPLVPEPATSHADEAGAVVEGDAAGAAGVVAEEDEEDMGRPPPPDPDLPPEDPDAMPNWDDSDPGALDADEVPHGAAGDSGVGGSEGAGVSPPPFAPVDCGDGSAGAPAARLLRRATAAAGAASTWVSNTTRGRASLRLLVGALSRLSPLPTPSAAAAAAADKCVSDAQAESSAARLALDEAERALSTAESAASPGSKDPDGGDGASPTGAAAERKVKVAAASGTSADPFGPDGVYRVLRGQCIRRKKSQYEFELCILERAAQFEGRRRIASLGNFVRWDDTDGSMLYEGGDSCWNGPRRSVRVAVTCGAGASEIVDVDEPSVCVYAMTLRTPAACVPSEANRLRRKAAALRSAAMAAQQFAFKDEL
ncbi:hypothetical protein MMPV_001269 [Pyropia vietnamensis]